MLRGALIAAVLAATAMASGQGPTSGAESRVRAPAFEVVSIHASQPGTGMKIRLSTTPDGYNATGQSLMSTIMLAYFPQGWAYWSRDRISGAPPWIMDQYDINAKVSDADRAEWQDQGVTPDKEPMLRAMLRTMLADRFHLVVHMVPGTPISGYSLKLGKHAPPLIESRPGQAIPAGIKLPNGGLMTSNHRGDKLQLTFYAATIADLAYALSLGSNGHPVQDHTGLMGHYDFIISWISDPNSKMPEGVMGPNDPDPLSHWNIEALGLSYAPIEIPADKLVIDHIEKPSEN